MRDRGGWTGRRVAMAMGWRGMGGAGRGQRGLGRVLLLGLAAALAGCQPPPAKPVAQASPDDTSAEDDGQPLQDLSGLSRLPGCPDGLQADLASGLRVSFQGAQGGDPDICVQAWNGRSYDYLLGFWGAGRFTDGTEAERNALRAVLLGPVGQEARFDLPRGRFAMWRSVTVTHVANEALTVSGGQRSAIKLRLLRNGVRPGVEAEEVVWIDRATGVPLRKATVTRLSEGGVRRMDTWRVTRLSRDGIALGGDARVEGGSETARAP